MKKTKKTTSKTELKVKSKPIELGPLTEDGGCILVKIGPGPLLASKTKKSRSSCSYNSRISIGSSGTFSLQLGVNAPDSTVGISLRGYFVHVVPNGSGEFVLDPIVSGTVGDYLDQTSPYFDGIATVSVGKTNHVDVDFVILEEEFMNGIGESCLFVVLGRGIGVEEGTLYECCIAYNVDASGVLNVAKTKKSVKKKASKQ